MIGYTYDQLYADLQAWPVSQSPEYQANLPRIISLAETDIVRDLNLDIFDRTDPGLVLSAGVRELPKPDGCIQVRYMMYTDADGEMWSILQRSQSYVKNYAPNPALLGPPRFYCEDNDEEWTVVPTPDADYPIEIKYILRPDTLAPGNQNTWIGDKCGELLFDRCLLRSDQYLKADDRYATWQSNYAQLLQTTRAELRNSIRSGDFSPIKPAASTTS